MKRRSVGRSLIRNLAGYPGPFAWGAVYGEAAPDHFGPVLHDLDAHPGLPGFLRRESRSIVSDLQLLEAMVSPEPNVDIARFAMTNGVHGRFLNDAVELGGLFLLPDSDALVGQAEVRAIERPEVGDQAFDGGEEVMR